MSKKVTRFMCPVCGAITAGRKPKNGDGTLMYPRRHIGKNKMPCAGSNEPAIWVELSEKDKRNGNV